MYKIKAFNNAPIPTGRKKIKLPFSISRTMGMISQMAWERALGIPITRPKSVTTDWIRSNT